MTKSFRGVAVLLALVVLAGIAGLHFAAAQVKDKDAKAKDAKDKDKVATGTTTFELYKDKGGEFRLRLRNRDGDLLAISGKGYDTEADCQKVIDAIRRDAVKAKVDDQTK